MCPLHFSTLACRYKAMVDQLSRVSLMRTTLGALGLAGSLAGGPGEEAGPPAPWTTVGEVLMVGAGAGDGYRCRWWMRVQACAHGGCGCRWWVQVQVVGACAGMCSWWVQVCARVCVCVCRPVSDIVCRVGP